MQAFGSVFLRRPSALAPTRDAACQEPFGPTEVVETDGLGVHGMDRGDGFQQNLRQPRPDLRPMREIGWQMFADHQAGPVFDDLEALPDDRRIVAQMQAASDEWQRIR